MADDLRILFVADVVGQPGREAVKAILPGLKRELAADVTVLNGENAAGGFGLTAKLVAELKAAGADVITTGNHVYAQKEFVNELPALENVIRPANYPPQAPGKGWCVVEAAGHEVLVMNLMGRIFLDPLDDPFRTADAILAAHPQIKIVFCDMHAEATSEKTAIGWYLDGRASAVVGTHTHIPTADGRVLPGGTAYVTDVGMVGPRDGCIGMDKEVVLQRFLTGVPSRFVVASGIVTFNSVLVTIRASTGRATSIQRIDREHI
ncbi:MAG: metallophosphoesterase [Chloroflexi bacterium 13_1_40CM_3_65_12]|nr:MAG: metallophosphoesterase [Chloroflexi bacterium 13_1_40CM_65_17]OLC66895.1 MAG: metallophosphoesterase [Actinobacteria bacterium 13_1_40CM_4_65_12]OLD27227.1 MAG: metallophosphoesterase [Chloroflexi bacterium 13_1_40CM_3_65_12]OLD49622.1 MAG: metallophosphoesterase [Actinobacteria bacterium 13_1_40CM_2_65_8]